MKKEQIIANIERYVNTLNEADRNKFTTALETAGKTQVPIKQVYPHINEPIFELAEIVQELKKELKEQAQKETRGNTFVKRSKLIAKLIATNQREDMKKGFFEEINGDKMQCSIINGFYAFMLKDALDIPMIEENEKQPFTMARCLPEYKHFDKAVFDVADIKTKIKMHKAKKDKSKCMIEISGRWYDAEFFIKVVDGLGGDITLYHNTKDIRQCGVFESENGLAILMPCRPPKV